MTTTHGSGHTTDGTLVIGFLRQLADDIEQTITGGVASDGHPLLEFRSFSYKIDEESSSEIWTDRRIIYMTLECDDLNER